MASIRILKKDVNYLTSAVLSDAYTYSLVCPEERVEKVAEILTSALNDQAELMDKINQARRADKKEVGKKMKEIRKEMFAKVDNNFKTLSELIQA